MLVIVGEVAKRIRIIGVTIGLEHREEVWWDDDATGCETGAFAIAGAERQEFDAVWCRPVAGACFVTDVLE